MIILILILIVILYLFIKFKFRKAKKGSIIAYSGCLGGGKSFNLTCDAIKYYRKSFKKWKKINKPSFIRRLFLKITRTSLCNDYFYGINEPKIFSNYPILIDKKKQIYSEVLTNEILLESSNIPFGSIVVIDEFSKWVNQFEYKKEFSNNFDDFIGRFRHYVGNYGKLLIADQCSNSLPIQVRYRLNKIIICLETRHFWFIHITKYKNINITDDIKSVELIDNNESDTDDKTLSLFRFSFIRRYDDIYFSNRYTFLNDLNSQNCRFIDSPLKTIFGLEKPSNNEKYTSLDVIIKSKSNIEGK